MTSDTQWKCEDCGEPITGVPAFARDSTKRIHYHKSDCIKALQAHIQRLKAPLKPRVWLIAWASPQTPRDVHFHLRATEAEAEKSAAQMTKERCLVYEIFEWICPDETAPE